ncbi:MAG: CvpA family protein [Oscillospiraceae bacterium]|nr:CvpA family protein [Oscillospiraceae bacterium]
MHSSTLALLLDGALLLAFVIVLARTVKRGFLASLLSIACWVLSLVCAGAMSAALAQPMYEGFVARPAQSAIEAKMTETVSGAEIAVFAEKTLAELPAALRELADFSGVSLDSLSANLDAAKSSKAQNAAELLQREIVAPVATAAIRWGLSIILFCLLLALSRLVARRLEKVGKLPVLKQVNWLLGVALGLLKGLLVVFVLALLLRVAGELGGGVLGEATEQARLPQLAEALPIRKGL